MIGTGEQDIIASIASAVLRFLALTPPEKVRNANCKEDESNVHEAFAPLAQEANESSISIVPAAAIIVREERVRNLLWLRILPIERLR